MSAFGRRGASLLRLCRSSPFAREIFGRGEPLQLPEMSLYTRCRLRPSGRKSRFSQSSGLPAVFAALQTARLPNPRFSRLLYVHGCYGPVTRSPPLEWLCQQTPDSSFPPCLLSKLRGSDFFPGGLPSSPLNIPALPGRAKCRRSFENNLTYDADINVGAPYKPLITRYISIFCEADRYRIKKERSLFLPY